MSETVDLSMLGAQVQELDRQLRLVRLRLDTLVSSTGNTNNRLTMIEQGSHGLPSEMARGFGQIQQQLTQHTRQLTVVETGLAELKTGLRANHVDLLAAIRGPIRHRERIRHRRPDLVRDPHLSVASRRPWRGAGVGRAPTMAA